MQKKNLNSSSIRISKLFSVFQCRIMRDMRNVNAKGVGKSLGYAFVNFNGHEHALQTLRHLNNNGEIFGNNKVCKHNNALKYSHFGRAISFYYRNNIFLPKSIV